MIWFTSDTHFGHQNIIKYCDRPFRDTDHMDAVLIEKWNTIVSPDDTVFHLGDVALGNIDKSLACVSRLNGYKILVVGNHDRPFMRADKPDIMDWWAKYQTVFQQTWDWRDRNTVILNSQKFEVSHFPYTGDHTPQDRHSHARPVDKGFPLIHGHTHTKDRLTYSSHGTPQIHVGTDAWDYHPVSEVEVMDIFVSSQLGEIG